MSEETVTVRVTVAIDLGSTYTGVAVRARGRARAQRHDKFDEPLNFTMPQVKEGSSLRKVPSIISLDGHRWGVQCNSLHVDAKHDLFKVPLATAQDRHRDVQGSPHCIAAQDKLTLAGTDAPEVTADYPRLLWAATKPAIDEAPKGVMDANLPRQARMTIDFDWVFTRPQSWPLQSQRRLCQAINSSGVTGGFDITPEMLLTEPAAALRYLPDQLPNGLRHNDGDTGIVCDIGGATIDSLYYHLKSSDPWDVRQVQRRESARQGRWGGGIQLGDEFLRWLRLTMSHVDGPYPTADDGAPNPKAPSSHERVAFLKENWEPVKVKHDVNAPGLDLEIPATWPNPEVPGQTMRLTREDIDKIFQPVLDGVTLILGDQLRLKYTAGVGRSRYPRELVRGICGNATTVVDIPQNRDVIRNAVATGAALLRSRREMD